VLWYGEETKKIRKKIASGIKKKNNGRERLNK